MTRISGIPTLPILGPDLIAVNADNFPFSESTLAGFAPAPSTEESSD